MKANMKCTCLIAWAILVDFVTVSRMSDFIKKSYTMSHSAACEAYLNPIYVQQYEPLHSRVNPNLFSLRLRGGNDQTKSMVVSQSSLIRKEERRTKDLNIDSFWNHRGLSEVTPWMISELDQKRLNKNLTSFEADLDNLLTLERRIQRSKRLKRQYNGSVLALELHNTEETLDDLYRRLEAAQTVEQGEHLRHCLQTAARKRDALERLTKEAAMERRYAKVARVLLRDERNRPVLTARAHSRWLDLVDGPGMDDGPPPASAPRPPPPPTPPAPPQWRCGSWALN